MNFLGMGPLELMLILVVALVVLGPGKLPEVAGQIGKAVRDFRRTTSELSGEFNRTLSLEVEERKSTASTVAPPAEPATASTADPATVASLPPAPVVSNGVVGTTATATAEEAVAAPSTAVAAPLASAPAAATASSSGSTNGDGSTWAWESSAPSAATSTAAVAEPAPAATPPESNGTAGRRAARKREFDPDLAPPY